MKSSTIPSNPVSIAHLTSQQLTLDEQYVLKGGVDPDGVIWTIIFA